LKDSNSAESVSKAPSEPLREEVSSFVACEKIYFYFCFFTFLI
jgi:hypothetical protein